MASALTAALATVVPSAHRRVIVKLLTVVLPTLLVAVMLNVLATPLTLYPTVLGVPDITPVLESKLIPEGRLPLLTLKVVETVAGLDTGIVTLAIM